ncbi:MAG: alpha-1,2-fucosyltransferase [bacterium]
MLIVRLQGGLGNQLFQYAFARALSLKQNKSVFLEKSFKQHKVFGITQREYALDVFAIEAQVFEENTFHKITSVIKRVLQKIVHIEWRGLEKSFAFDQKMLTIKDGYFDGYWQSYKYFEHIESIIKNELVLKVISPEIKQFADQIETEKSLAIHIRRGDFVNNKKHEVVKNDYYEKAIKIIESTHAVEHIYVFSDDIAWCEEHLHFDYPTTFVPLAYEGKHGEGHLHMMSKCQYFIIPNSTFAWWGAWLSNRKDKIVITPKIWRNDILIPPDDLLPPDWVKI